jgi:CheY-like chemotaxis protein
MSLVMPSSSLDTSQRAPALAGLSILIAEDEFLLAAQLEDELIAAGCSLLGPYTSVAKATEASRDAHFDLALLDVNLNGELVYPLADELRTRSIPFVLLSGYGAPSLPERFRSAPRVAKPHDQVMLFREIRRALGK